MKLKGFGIALALAGVLGSVHADVCIQAPGSINCGKGTIPQLNGNGVVSVNGTIIEGLTSVNGMLMANNANFSQLNINGTAQLSSCTVRAESEIKGALKATSTQFEGSVSIYSNAIHLDSSKISSTLHIKHTENPTQAVHLDNKSEISGDIIFDDGKGEVYLKGDSKVLGTVTGGKIVKQ